jgi:hypothetical protein
MAGAALDGDSAMTELFPPTLDELIACARRELEMRRRVYLRWVLNGKMTEDKANRELMLMETIVGTLLNLKEQEGSLL